MTVTLDTEVTLTFGQLAILVTNATAGAFAEAREAIVDKYPAGADVEFESAADRAEFHEFATHSFAKMGNIVEDKSDAIQDGTSDDDYDRAAWVGQDLGSLLA